MFQYSSQWLDPKMQKQLVDPSSTYIGKTKILSRSKEYLEKKRSGMYHSNLVRTCRGVDEIENYTNMWEDVHGVSSCYAYHYFDYSERIWRTDFVKLTLKTSRDH